jgi:hypothetical protein
LPLGAPKDGSFGPNIVARGMTKKFNKKQRDDVAKVKIPPGLSS